jgi:hypothetical protein
VGEVVVLFELYGGKKKWMLPKRGFFNALPDAATQLFEHMELYFPQNDYDVELAQIKRLRKKIEA